MTWLDLVLYGPGWLALPMAIVQLVLDHKERP